MEIYLADTQGFCAGVSRAIETVNTTLNKCKAPIYVFHHIVHNTSVIKDFEKKGVVFVESIEEIPKGSIAIFSAHGVSPKIIQQANERALKIIDATCPIVTKIHYKAQRFSQRGIQTILIGHKKHQEIIGTAGYVKPELLSYVEQVSDVEKIDIKKEQKLSYLTQTTLSIWDTDEIIMALRTKFPQILNPAKWVLDDIKIH